MPTNLQGELYRILELLDAANVPGDTLANRVENLIADRNCLEAALRVESRKTTYARLMDELAADPSVILHAIADACLDEGNPEEMGWRYLANGHRWPIRQKAGWWMWCIDPEGTVIPEQYNFVLPVPTFRDLEGDRYRTHLDALRAAALIAAKLPR